LLRRFLYASVPLWLCVSLFGDDTKLQPAVIGRPYGMTSYFLQRLFLIVPTLFGISIISFLIIHLAPGDPTALKFGEEQRGGNPAQIIAETRALYGLDQPLLVQYVRWLRRILTFDFGESLRDHRPVIEKLKERIPVSVRLSGISIVLAYLLSIPLGIYSATHRNTIAERFTTVLLFAFYSLPSFWVATMAIVYFGGGDFWNVFPVYGLKTSGSENWPWWQQLKDEIWHLVLPVLCMTYYSMAVLSRYMRTCMLETIGQDFIRTARAKGLSDRLVVYRHALRNSLIPIVTLSADLLPAIIGGSIVIETLFSIPGMGLLSYEAVFNRDYPLLMGIFTLSSLLTLAGILISDFLYTIVDPRIAYGKRAPA
jgi:peptide/nickel transport system permease protein